MELSTWLTIVLSSNLASSPEKITFVQAKNDVIHVVQSVDIKDPHIIDKIPFLLTELEYEGRLTKDVVELLTRELVKSHYFESSSDLNFLPKTIETDLYGDLDAQDLYRVFYIEHVDQQRDGWSCGFRSACNAAALHAFLAGNPDLLDQKEIGRLSKELYQTNPGIKGILKYICDLAKIRAAKDVVCIGLIQEKANNAKLLLEQNHVNLLEVISGLQQDYFIVDLAKHFLLCGPLLVDDAVEVLSCAFDQKVKAIGVQLAADKKEFDDNKIEKEESLERYKSALDKLEGICHSHIQEALELMCSLDKKVDTILKLLKKDICPKIKIASALLVSSHVTNKQIVDMLMEADHQDKDAVVIPLKNNLHEVINRVLKDLAEFDNAHVEQAIKVIDDTEDPIISDDPDIKEGRRLLEPFNVETIKKARRCFQKAEHKAIEKAVNKLAPDYPCEDPQFIVLQKSDQEKIVKLLDNPECPHIKEAFEILEKDSSAFEDACNELKASQQPNKEDAKRILGIDCLNIEEEIQKFEILLDGKVVAARAKALACNIPLNLRARSNNGEQGVCADPDHLMDLCSFEELGVPPENVHIIGNFQNQGICFNLNDPILQVVKLNGVFDENNQEHTQKRIKESIAKHFKDEYVDKDAAGAHYFLCNLSRPSKHWIMIALVNLPNKKPILLILDSINGTINSAPESNNDGAERMIAFLYNAFIKDSE